jgi:hypothetical protein
METFPKLYENEPLRPAKKINFKIEVNNVGLALVYRREMRSSYKILVCESEGKGRVKA